MLSLNLVYETFYWHVYNNPRDSPHTSPEFMSAVAIRACHLQSSLRTGCKSSICIMVHRGDTKSEDDIHEPCPS